ncbi:hypothetical protein [Lamprobacter modestohalophilus]|uniref:hypothetical protein n=1 Tax=Lamprobacter modestohalophilus TaxID=1064514 RepID=UPI001906A5B4|nr:hypothetical protein [Lamprobacter modestohalophilus]
MRADLTAFENVELPLILASGPLKPRRARVTETLEALNAKGLTLVVVTHDASLGERARRRIQMDDGAILCDAPH